MPQEPRRRFPAEIQEKILHLRRTYHFGRQRITWYLARYHDIKVSTGGVYLTLKRNELNRLPRNMRGSRLKSVRYEKQVPGHHVQIDVKFLKLRAPDGRVVRRFQYTAIDDATRIRALRIYRRHTQKNAIVFVDYVIRKFPFRIHTVRTDNGHEFQAQFHWHVEDLGIRHQYIKPRTPRLNGKVERSHGTDEREFCPSATMASNPLPVRPDRSQRTDVNFEIRLPRSDDHTIVAEMPALPGVLVATIDAREALRRIVRLAWRR